MTKRIRLFGGSFDPVHNGHLKAAQDIFDVMKLNHIYFIPAHVSPFKTEKAQAQNHHRLEMLKLALKGSPYFSVSEYELNKKEVSYTIDTLRHYKKLLGESTELYFILGSDAFLDLPKWKDIEDIFSLTHIVVVSRPGYRLKPLSQILENPMLQKEFVTLQEGKDYKHYTGHHIYLHELEAVDISSTQLRSMITQQKPYSSFVSPLF